MIDEVVLVTFLAPPIYLFSEGYVRKVYGEIGSLKYQRYEVDDARCTCPAYIKWSMCKHQNMRAGGFNWVKGGLPANTAAEHANRILAVMGVQGHRVDGDSLPSHVRGVTIAVPDLAYRLVTNIIKMSYGRMGLRIERLGVAGGK